MAQLLPYLQHFVETGKLHEQAKEKAIVGVALRKKPGLPGGGAGAKRRYYHRECLTSFIAGLCRYEYGEQWEGQEEWITLGEAQEAGYICDLPGCVTSLAQPYRRNTR